MKAPTSCRITIDGVSIDVEPGQTVAAVFANSATPLRKAVSGEPRGVLCGMGICHECRMTIDGIANRRACMIIVADGMRIESSR